MSWLCSIPLAASLFSSCAAPDPLAVGYVEGEYVLLAPMEAAQVETLSVKRGDRFTPGQELVKLETRDTSIAVSQTEAALATAQAQLADLQLGKRPEEIAVLEAALTSAEAQADQARKTLDRTLDLFRRGTATQAQLDAARTQVAVQEAMIGQAKALFGVPFVGSLPLLLSAILVFVLALVLLGYTISTLARTQMQAMQLTFFFFLPSILLSGFMFPYRGMPGWAQMLGEALPLTHFLRIIRGVMLKGAEFPAIAGEVGALAIFVVVFATLALLRFRRTLD